MRTLGESLDSICVWHPCARVCKLPPALGALKDRRLPHKLGAEPEILHALPEWLINLVALARPLGECDHLPPYGQCVDEERRPLVGDALRRQCKAAVGALRNLVLHRLRDLQQCKVERVAEGRDEVLLYVLDLGV